MKPSEVEHCLDPKVVAQLRDFRLRARMVVDGFMQGLHKGPRHAFSLEYDQHRDYYPGDPLKLVDWKLYAKTDRFFTKQYQEETNLRAWLVLDISGSMRYTGDQTSISKIRYGSFLAAAIAQLLLDQKDATGLILFDDRIRKLIKPSASNKQLNHILYELQNLKEGSQTGFEKAAKLVAGHIKSRGLIILFSDLLLPPDEIEKMLKSLMQKGNDLIVFHILSEEEIKFPFAEFGFFEDMETSERILLQPKLYRDEYLSHMNSYLENVRKICLKYKSTYQLLQTTTSLDQALLTFVKTRARAF